MVEKQDLTTTHEEGVHGVGEDTTYVVPGYGETAKPEGAKTKKVFNALLYAAIEETDIERWSKTSIHLYFAIFVSFCCACANGYDGSLMGAALAMKYFQNTFHTGLSGEKVSVVTALYTVGSMVAAPLSAVVSDKLGRRKCMFVGAWVIIIGSILVASSHSLAQFVVGRWVLGVGIQVMIVSAPAYAVEIAPPHWRGRAVGFYNCGWFGGSIPAAAITFGTNYIDSNWSWRIPFICQCFACVIVIFAVWFIPESPRWLMAHDRHDEAVAFLVKYHGNGDPNARLVRLEVEEMREGIRIDGIDKRWWDYRPFIFSHSGRWRFLQVIMISVFGQWSGNGLGYFNPTIYESLGYTSSSMQLLLNLVNSIVSAIGALTAVYFTDRMPRRPVLVWGTLACAVTMAINAGVSEPLISEKATTGTINNTYGQVALAFYYLFNVVFSFTYTPLQGVIPAEALETTTRAKGLALSGFMVNCIGFISQFASPIGLANISTNYFWIFVGWDVFEALCWYLFGVEAQGRTLEELEWIYQQPNPVKASQNLDRVVVQSDGRVTEKIDDEN
ncbi:putative MFS lactose permease [Talaromyces proteolyticus]|uniref:MFS lactose permease n=1 Tax=Talaromyces proteolyticus TaxID=1131652 RepID=A0AAD4PYI6_9EURO|nr:putative MFS lactose permease [Talaromyces proteolyticus]KAH8694299.1 putative MFS lactose permease [Talaromyces proteolyticus]